MSNLKVPLEALSHQFRRTQKIISRDMNSINEQIAAVSAENISQEDLEEISLKLQYLVELVESSDCLEKGQLASLEARIREESQQMLRPTKGGNNCIDDSKIIVMIADALLRRGLFDAVNALIEDAGDWLRHHADIQIYESAARVEAAILSGDMETVLQWCTDHASKLRRLNSAITFFIRQEQFLDLVYAGRTIDALRFAQEHLAPLVVDNPEGAATTPSSSRRPSEQEDSPGVSDSSIAKREAAVPGTSSGSGNAVQAGGSLRQRAVSLGSTPSSHVARPAAPEEQLSTAAPSDQSGRSSHSTSRPGLMMSVPSFSPGFSFPFSLSSNPLAFFHYAHSAGPQSSSGHRSAPSRSAAPPASAGRTHTGGSRPQRNRSASVTSEVYNSAPGTPQDCRATAAANTIQNEIEIDAARQSAFLKEAMCHLMSMLAFVQTTSSPSVTLAASALASSLTNTCMKTPTREAAVASGSPASSTWTASSLFGSMVPHMYEQAHTSHRRRCIADFFRLEFRRVYSLPRVCALERLVQMGLFSLKTPSCGDSSCRLRGSNVTSARPSRISFGSVSVMSGSGGHSSTSGGPNAGSNGSSGLHGDVSVDSAPPLARSSSPGGAVVMNALRLLQHGIGGSGNSRPTAGQQQQSVSRQVASPFSSHPNSPPELRESGQGIGYPARHNASGGIPLPACEVVGADSLQMASHLKARSCPVCARPGQVISHTMPCPLRTSSQLRCRGTGEVIDHENPAMALPNGQVYSRAFIMRNAFESVQRKRKSRYLSAASTSPPSASSQSPPAISFTTAPVVVGDLPVGNDTLITRGSIMSSRGDVSRDHGARHAAAIDLLLHFRRVRLERDRAKEEGPDMTGTGRGVVAFETPFAGGDGVGETRSISGGDDAMEEELHQSQQRLQQYTEGIGDARRDWDHSQTQPKLLFTCPVTQQTFDVDQIRAVYIV